MNSNAGSTVRIIPLAPKHAVACEAIARALPAWFGIEEGLADLCHCIASQPGFVAIANGQVAGFLTIDTPFPETREITWMAVSPDHRRQGIGRALVEAAIVGARASGARILHVKTLADLHPSPEYVQTRAFYQAMGFHRLIVLPELWGPANPCLLMVRPI